jgi:CRISPR-associated protein (TIGR03986 family)
MSLKKITAPYNFVPLSKWIYFPDWAEYTSIDIPFRDGINGAIDIELTNNTPLLIGGKTLGDKPKKVYPFQTPDGQFAIPGSSIRGLVRSIVEIITFSKMSLIDDSKVGFRDLKDNGFYKTNIVQQPEKKSGWLRFENGNWSIIPCDWARVKAEDLNQYLAAKIISTGNVGSDDSVIQKYAKWPLSKLARFNIVQTKYYPLATDFESLEAKYEGHIVFTGPIDKKKMDYVFYNFKSHSKPVSQKLINEFMLAHDNAHGTEIINELKDQPLGIPIFYIEQKNQINHIGLSKMPRVALDLSTHHARNNTSAHHGDTSFKDFTENLFGSIGDDVASSQKSRVSFGILKSDNAEQIDWGRACLASPKPTFYPNYLKQKAKEGALTEPTYNTFWSKSAELRGWKRYPTSSTTVEPVADNDAIETHLHPLAANATFNGTFKIHNLKPVELGALLWALTMGGQASAKLNIGLGKPLGFGGCKITITDMQLTNNTGQRVSEEIRFFIDLFTEHMSALYKEYFKSDWKSSPQILHLQRFAQPTSCPQPYMDLDKFAKAKGAHKNKKLTLENLAPDEELALNQPTALAKDMIIKNRKLLQSAEMQAEKERKMETLNPVGKAVLSLEYLVGEYQQTSQLDAKQLLTDVKMIEHLRACLKETSLLVLANATSTEKEAFLDVFKCVAELLSKDGVKAGKKKQGSVNDLWKQLNS